MKLKHKITLLHRFDRFYSSIDTKGLFILSFNGIFLGFIFSQHSIITSITSINIHFFLILSILLSILSFIFVILSIMPFLNSNNKSVWFFKDIKEMGFDSFNKRIDSLTKKSQNEDINSQIFHLSKGLTKKYRRITIALWFTLFQIIAFAIFLFNVFLC